MLGVAHLFCQGVADPDLEIVASENHILIKNINSWTAPKGENFDTKTGNKRVEPNT